MNYFPSNYKTNAKQSMGLSFIRIYNMWHREIKEALKELYLTHPQFVVLASIGYLLQHKAEINQTAIAKQSDIDVMTVSTIVRNLEKQDLVTRQESVKDTRAKVVCLTNKGQAILERALPIVETIDEDFFATLGSDQSTFHSLLHRLVDKQDD